VQEAIIGVVFVLGSSAAILLLARDPHGGENLKELLVGQILWVTKTQLLVVAVVYAVVLALWFGLRERLGRIGFYALFGCVVTVSVQLVGLYLVFATLVVPALSTFYTKGRRHPKAYAVGVLGYAIGLLASLWLDLPSGSMIVCTIAAAGALVAFVGRPRPGA
jgi:zinc/manganese transport system permease protein